MKAKKRKEILKARQDDWDKIPPEDRKGTTRPGSEKK